MSLDFSDVEQQQKAYSALSKDAIKIIMPLEDTFWGARFGIRWVFKYDYPHKQ